MVRGAEHAAIQMINAYKKEEEVTDEGLPFCQCSNAAGEGAAEAARRHALPTAVLRQPLRDQQVGYPLQIIAAKISRARAAGLKALG
eukprot:2972658-Pyramimonas_sp.AAC.1